MKTCLQNKKSYLMPPSRHYHFHLILILPMKMVELVQQHANTTVHCIVCIRVSTPPQKHHPPFLPSHPSLKSANCPSPPLFRQSPPLYWVFVNLIFRFCVKTSLFSYYFEMLPPLSKVIVFFSVTFYSMIKYF